MITSINPVSRQPTLDTYLTFPRLTTLIRRSNLLLTVAEMACASSGSLQLYEY